MTLLSDEVVKARVAHGCDLCCGNVKPGELYRRQVHISPDGFNQWVSCGPCSVVSGLWFEHVGSSDDTIDGGSISLLVEDLIEAIGKVAFEAAVASSGLRRGVLL